MNKEHLEILRQGYAIWNKWRIDNPNIIPDLRRANLNGADLEGANLSCVDLEGANLSGANLSDSDLSGAYSKGVNLRDANLSSANLSGAYLNGADLSGVNLFNSTGNKKEIITFQTEFYVCNFTKDFLSIDRKTFSYEKWFGFSDQEISVFEEKALVFWSKYKETIKTLKASYGF